MSDYADKIGAKALEYSISAVGYADPNIMDAYFAGVKYAKKQEANKRYAKKKDTIASRHAVCVGYAKCQHCRETAMCYRSRAHGVRCVSCKRAHDAERISR